MSTRSLRWAAIVPACAVLALAAPAAGQEPVADTAGVHVVRRGDTLWDLARQYLTDPFRWPEIFRINQDQVENPHWIFPRERLRIPGLGGPRLLGDPLAGAPAEAPPSLLQERPPPRTVFFPQLSLEGRRLLGPGDVPSPAVARGEFYSAGVLVPEDRIQPVGRLTEVVSPTVVSVGIPGRAQPYERVYMVVEVPGSVQVGDALHLIREGRRVRPFGRIFESTGIGRVLAVDGATATIEVQEHFDAIAVGNLAVALPDYEVPLGVRPRGAAPGVEGRLIAFQVSQPVQGVRDFGFVDLGRDAGMVEGDVLEAVLPPERKQWGVRPEIVIGRLQVVRVAERTSAVQVISMEHPAIEPGLLVRVVAKMPTR